MVHRRHPALRRLVLGIGVLERLALDFEHHIERVGQPDDEVRFIDLRVAVKLIRNVELQPVIARIAEDDSLFRQLFELEGGRLLP